MKLQVIDFVECDYCEEDGIINNYVYEHNKKNLNNIKCWNCDNVYIVDSDYMHKVFNQEVN
jgi:hypothetical protein